MPVQSVLLSSEGNFGMDWISGETDLRRWQQGEIIPSGALSLHSTPLLFQAKEPWSGSLLHALLDVQERRTHRNLILEKFVKNYLTIILAIAVIAGAAWYWKTGNGLVALQVVTSILVVSCPCASGVAIPMVDDRSALCLRRLGVYVRESTLWYRLLRVKKIIFDKTGTVTMESLELDSPQCLRKLTLEQQERLFSLSRSSLHPVCTALRKELLALNTRLDQSPVIGVIEEVIGQGVEMKRGEGVDRLGRASWAIGKEGPGTVWSYQGEIVLEFEFKEKIRESARETIQQLIRQNYEIYLLSGDRSEKVRKMANELGVSDARAFGGMTPQEKESWVRKNDLSDTLMLGDGANDSLAFNQSFCTGTPAINRSFLQKKSDFYWMGQSLKGIAILFEVAKMRERTIRRIITFAILYNSVVIGISVCGGMSPVLAAILMPSSSLITLLIAMSGMPLRLGKQK